MTLILLAVVTLVFLILQMIPGDPARAALGPEASLEDLARFRRNLGLDLPLPVQYGRFLAGLLQGDLGTSYITGRPVLGDAMDHFRLTLLLAVSSVIFATVFGVALGVPAGARPHSVISALTMLLALVGISVPAFWLGLLLMLAFSLTLNLLPAGGADSWQSLILPTITLGSFSLGVIARHTRASVAEVVHLDYVRTARAKGLRESIVLMKHVLPNALIPIVTVMGLRFGYMLGGAVATETVFNWPGLGRFVVSGVLTRDYPSVQAGLLIFAVCLVVVNLLVDLSYGLIDPRIRIR